MARGHVFASQPVQGHPHSARVGRHEIGKLGNPHGPIVVARAQARHVGTTGGPRPGT